MHQRLSHSSPSGGTLGSVAPLLASAALAASVLLAPACGQTVTPEPELSAEGAQPPPAPESAPIEQSPPEPQACGGGAIKDDGSVETGYGFVPSAVEGRYVQEFHSADFPTRALAEVCVCWLRSRADSDLDFEVVFYQDRGGRPAEAPYAEVKATATEVPEGVDAAGRLYPVEVSGVELPEGTSYIGVRWNPSASTYFFICGDTSKETALVNVFSAEDRSPAWTNVKNSRDPVFRPHRAILVRAKAVE